MKKKIDYLTLLIFVLTLGIVFIGCKDDNPDGGYIRTTFTIQPHSGEITKSLARTVEDSSERIEVYFDQLAIEHESHGYLWFIGDFHAAGDKYIDNRGWYDVTIPSSFQVLNHVYPGTFVQGQLWITSIKRIVDGVETEWESRTAVSFDPKINVFTPFVNSLPWDSGPIYVAGDYKLTMVFSIDTDIFDGDDLKEDWWKNMSITTSVQKP